MFTGLLPWQHGIRDNISPGRRPAGAAAGRGLQGARLRHRRLRLLDGALAARPASAAASTSTTTGSPPRRGIALHQHPAAARRRDPRRGHAVDRGQPRAGAASSCGSTSTIPTIRTSRPSRTPRASAAGPTTARSPSPTRWWAGSTTRWPGWASGDQTLLVVTSDHGEGLGEHGETLHGFFVYQTTLAVPLVAARSRHRARERGSRATVGLVDLYPTAARPAGLSAARGRHARRAQPRPRAARRRRAAGGRPCTRSPWCRCCTSAGATCASCARAAGSTSRPRGRSSTTWPPIPASAATSPRAQPARAAAFQSALGRVLDEERQGGRGRAGAPRARRSSWRSWAPSATSAAPRPRRRARRAPIPRTRSRSSASPTP